VGDADCSEVAVVGAGAAGLAAAIAAASAGADVLLIERTRDGGRKILISGGGRCNVLPSDPAPRRFVTASSPHTLRLMLSAWPLARQRTFFEEEVGVPLTLEADTGKLFPVSSRARDVRDGLVALSRRRGVRFAFGSSLVGLAPLEPGLGFRLDLEDGRALCARAVVMATGGLSVPSTGSDGLGLRLLEGLGHRIHPTYPALTPLIAEPAVHGALSGVSLPVAITAGSGPGDRSQGGFVFTHRGYSGPAVLDVSHVAVRSRLDGSPAPVRVRWADLDEESWEVTLRQGGSETARSVLRSRLPLRLAETLLAECGIDPGRPLGQVRRDERRQLVERLVRYPLPWTGDEGYRKAEVTGGGVALSEVDRRSLESRLHPGLFLCGELLDAFGPIGGHNFAWAWSTGRAAGLGAASRVR
jgi:predicted Rossmann fold flavoprotein